METKTKIIKSFFDLIQEKSIFEISNDDIIKKAKISKRTFYNYFTYREDIINAISKTIETKMIIPINQKIEDSVFDKIENVNQYTKLLLEILLPVFNENLELLYDLDRSKLNYLWKDPLQKELYDALLTTMIKHQVSNLIMQLVTMFTTSAIEIWIQEKSASDYDTINLKLNKLINSSINGIVEGAEFLNAR